MPYLVLSLTVKTAETVIKDDNVLLRIYSSRKRLYSMRVSAAKLWWGDGKAHYALALTTAQCNTLASNLRLISLGQLAEIFI